MTNVIVDAGTDAKIAKFQRRGIVLIDLASLEPVEVWGDHPSCVGRANGEDSQPMPSRIPMTLSIPASSGGQLEYHLTALPSVTSLNPVKTSQSEILQQNYPEPQPQPHLPFPPNLSDDSDATPVSTPKLPATSAAKRNFFGKLFQGNANKKTKNSPSRSPAPSPSPMTDRLPLPSKPTSKVSQLPSSSNSLPPISAENIRPAEKGHTKNIRLTTYTVPMKATLKSKNRLSVATTNSSSSLNGSTDAQGVGLGLSQGRNSNLIAPSPNVSASSLAATTESVESESIAHGNLSLLTTPHHHQLSHSTSLTTPTNPLPPQTQLQKLQSRPPVLGIQPTFVSALGSNLSGTCGKKMRALMYVWIIRRWLKQPAHDDNSSSHSPTGRGGFLGLGSGSRGDEQNGNAAELGSGIEVRFEWKRGKVKSSNRGRTRNTKGEVGDRRSSMTAHDDRGVAEKNGGARRKRSVNRTSSLSGSGKSSRSIGSGAGSEEGSEELRRRGLRRPTSSHNSSEGMGESGDDGDESDPEDSETPWVCTLKVRRTTAPCTKNGRLGLKQSSRTGEKVLKLKVATLSPTPHHPKVVAMLKVPFPLPDIEVERLCLRRRLREVVPGQDNVNDTGLTPPDACDGNYDGLELAAEDIKDIICSTALWLIVREGIAGVGRVSRKGDGWKLRS